MNQQSTNFVGNSQSEACLGRIYHNVPGPVDRAMSPGLSGYSAVTQARGLDTLLLDMGELREPESDQFRRELNDGDGMYDIAGSDDEADPQPSTKSLEVIEAAGVTDIEAVFVLLAMKNAIHSAMHVICTMRNLSASDRGRLLLVVADAFKATAEESVVDIAATS